MNKFFVATLIVTIMMMSPTAPATEPDGFTEDLFATLMKATVRNDYDGFVANCDDTMKAALSKTQLEAVSKQIAPRIEGGHDTDYLGELNQKGFAVHLWRLRFKSGDDVLVTLSVKDGKVGGFYLH